MPDRRCLFAEGDPPIGIFLILRGRIKPVRSSSGGREQVLHEEGDGATLGEVPAFDGGGYVGTAVAVGDTSVLFGCTRTSPPRSSEPIVPAPRATL